MGPHAIGRRMASPETFVALLQAARIARVVDVRGVEVLDGDQRGSTAPHQATEGVRREGDAPVYDSGQGRRA